MDPASLILQVAEKLWGLRNELSRVRRDRRDRVADYFTTIGACLRDVAASLRNDVIPHGKCAEMEVYASRLAETVGEAIGNQVAEEQAAMLREAHQVEWLLSELDPGHPEREMRLAKIERASGIFDALAATIRAAR